MIRSKSVYLLSYARTGSANREYNVDQFDRHDTTSHPFGSNRASKDTVLNARGKNFLDVLLSTNISLHVFGEFTCLHYNRNSVVDYIAASENLKSKAISPEILELT